MFNKGTEIRKFKKGEEMVTKEVQFLSGLGNLTADCPPAKAVEVNGKKTTVAGGYPLSIAFNQGKNKPAVFYRVEAWGRTAELLAEYGKKGIELYVFGRVVDDSYEKDGEKVTAEKLVVETFKMTRASFGNNSAPADAPAQEEAPQDFEPAGDEEFEDIPF